MITYENERSENGFSDGKIIRKMSIGEAVVHFVENELSYGGRFHILPEGYVIQGTVCVFRKRDFITFTCDTYEELAVLMRVLNCFGFDSRRKELPRTAQLAYVMMCGVVNCFDAERYAALVTAYKDSNDYSKIVEAIEYLHAGIDTNEVFYAVKQNYNRVVNHNPNEVYGLRTN